MTAGYKEFEFDLPDALLARLVDILDGMDSVSLLSENINDIPDAQGVYQLFFNDELVYIGKTDAEAGLRRRLGRHVCKIQHRSGLDPARVTFKAVRIYVFTAVDLETQLITHYGGRSVVRWNGSGFGSNDPGRERESTNYKENHFDATFPIDINRPLYFDLPAKETATNVFSLLKSNLPYVLRYQYAKKRSRKAHSDLEDTIVLITADRPMTTRRLIEQTVRRLPTGWQATKLPSHIIIYKEIKNYDHGEIIAKS